MTKFHIKDPGSAITHFIAMRSEERRVGKECL